MNEWIPPEIIQIPSFLHYHGFCIWELVSAVHKLQITQLWGLHVWTLMWKVTSTQPSWWFLLLACWSHEPASGCGKDLVKCAYSIGILGPSFVTGLKRKVGREDYFRLFYHLNYLRGEKGGESILKPSSSVSPLPIFTHSSSPTSNCPLWGRVIFSSDYAEGLLPFCPPILTYSRHFPSFSIATPTCRSHTFPSGPHSGQHLFSHWMFI